MKTKLRLSERTFRCDECPLVLDRDFNAARNLVALVGEVMGGTWDQVLMPIFAAHPELKPKDLQ